jgi:hypothetical protein
VTTLRTFQDAFANALLAADASPVALLGDLPEQPGFAVYRNTVVRGCIDALQANYPAVCRLVGEEWFRAAAAVFVRREPPRDPLLVTYGAGFPRFLVDFAPARDLPYLPGVARLDRFWSEAHVARDEAPVAAAKLDGLGRERLGRTLLRPHASARWAWFPAAPIHTLWRRNRPLASDPAACAPPLGGATGAGSAAGGAPGELVWRSEGGLVVRPHGAVCSIALDAAGCAFLDACASGEALAEAAAASLAIDPGTDLAQLLATLLHVGAFASPDARDADAAHRALPTSARERL